MLARNGRIDVLFDTANSSFTGMTEVQNVEKKYILLRTKSTKMKNTVMTKNTAMTKRTEMTKKRMMTKIGMAISMPTMMDTTMTVMRKNRNIPLSTKRRTLILP